MIESKGHKITPIDGDLAVSRNAEIGRDVDIQGKARVAGSLKVEGFLDAPHIKGVAKGLFNSVEELKKEYPNPRSGWFAIVLDATNKETGILYKAENRVWVATTNKAKPYQFIQDSINVFASKNELIDTREDLETAINITTEALADTITNIKGNALQYNKIGFSVYADKIVLYAKNISDNSVRYDEIPAATAEKAGVMSAEDKRNLNNSTVKVITWNNDTDPSNMNDFVVAGVYDIKGERTRADDNLPILNTGGGHSFNARLTVLDSSISGSGEDDDKCITQVLSFSNRLGQGEVYIRTGKGSSLDNLTWENWSTLQRNVNVDTVTSLDHLIDNGIYSGVYVKNNANIETFVMVVINNYALADINTVPKSVSQFKYSVSLGGSFPRYETRVGTGVNDWSEWEILNQMEISSMIKSSVDNAIKGIIADAPEAFDTLKEIADWIANDKTGAVALANAISANTKAINTEATRATEAEEEISHNAIAADSMGHSTTTTDMSLEFETLNGKSHGSVTFPSATAEQAGVMSAADKQKLDNLSPGGGGSGGGDYTLPIATADVLGGIKSNSTYGYIGDNPFGNEHAVNVDNDGRATVTIPVANNQKHGVVKVDSSVNSESDNPVSSKAVSKAIANIGGGGGGDITATPTEEVIEEIEPTLVSTAIRKTPQVLTDSEKEIARGNIGAVSYSDLSFAIAEAITNTLNTAV